MQLLTSTAGLVGLGLVLLLVVVQRVRDYARTKHIPGPFWAGWTDLWMIRAQLSGRMCFILAETNVKYGRLAHFFP